MALLSLNWKTVDTLPAVVCSSGQTGKTDRNRGWACLAGRSCSTPEGGGHTRRNCRMEIKWYPVPDANPWVHFAPLAGRWGREAQIHPNQRRKPDGRRSGLADFRLLVRRTSRCVLLVPAARAHRPDPAASDPGGPGRRTLEIGHLTCAAAFLCPDPQTQRGSRMKRLCEAYVRNAKLIGALYCAVPVAIWYCVMFATVPFRLVYVLRLVLSLTFGCWLAAYSNSYGVRLWLTKHGSPDGPATGWDGFVIGSAVGMGTVLLPPLAALIATNHPAEARTLIIVCWLLGIACGALNGSFLGSIGRRFVDRDRGVSA